MRNCLCGLRLHLTRRYRYHHGRRVPASLPAEVLNSIELNGSRAAFNGRAFFSTDNGARAVVGREAEVRERLGRVAESQRADRVALDARSSGVFASRSAVSADVPEYAEQRHRLRASCLRWINSHSRYPRSIRRPGMLVRRRIRTSRTFRRRDRPRRSHTALLATRSSSPCPR